MVPDYFVHPSSYVDDGVAIGKGTRIWHFCHIMAGATIGEDCSFGQNTFVGKDVRIGNYCRIQNNVSVFEGVVLEDGVFCGPSAVFTNVTTPRALYPRQEQGYVPTVVRYGATIGANATIVCGVTIGRHAMIGAGSVVTLDVPDYGLAYGVPARLRGWVCECGTKLNFKNGKSSCPGCQRRFVESSKTMVKEEPA